MHIGRLAARAAIGSLFIGHGTQKLFGWFGGPGPAGTEGMMTSLTCTLRAATRWPRGPPRPPAAPWSSPGLATPLAAAGLIGTMVTAIRKVHWANGPWAANGGYEYNLVLIAALAALVETGPGDLSLDAVLGRKTSGPVWALGALAAGAASSALVVELGRRSAPAADGRARGAVPGHRRGPGHRGLKVRTRQRPARTTPRVAVRRETAGARYAGQTPARRRDVAVPGGHAQPVVSTSCGRAVVASFELT